MILRTENESMMPQARLTVRLMQLFLIATLFTAGFLVFISSNLITYIKYDKTVILKSKHNSTIYTEGCTIPALNPMDESIEKHVFYPQRMAPCHNANQSLLGHDHKRIWIRKENFNYFNIGNKSNLSCCYQSFYRPVSIKNITSDEIDHRVKYKRCLHFNDSIAVHNEFVRVKCKYEQKKIFEQYFLFAPKKPFLKHDHKKEISKRKPAYNVLVLGIDAVSRLNFHRTMPKTLNFLKAKGAVELLGYNKVGDNTFPNLMPMLVGVSGDELHRTCHPHTQATFDNCPFVWEWFKQAGYYTALGEDCSNIGTFNYLLTGFSNTPTDYYLHTFIHEAQNHVGNNLDANTYLCMNDQYFYKVLLDYVQNITTTLQDTKMFGFFWEITMSHDFLNYPMIMDNDYLQMLTELDAKKYLENTVLFLVSDHGIRWGGIRSTKQGRLEERLPFVYILTPPAFRVNYKEAYNNLIINSGRLTTPFDLHATLMDLVDLDNIQNDTISSRSSSRYANDRSISLFLPIPNNRTCAIAGIDDHWCTCLKEVPIAKTDAIAIQAAAALVQLINSLLVKHSQCTKLTLAELLDVTELEAGKPEEDEMSWREILVVIRTMPGGGEFEATLRTDGNNWTLVDNPSRLNLYGEQSRCIQDPKLKLYCYCK